MDFEELHGKSGSGMSVGVDLTTLMTSQIATSTAGKSGGGGSGGGDMTVPRIASFQVYWDVPGKQFKVFSPKVVDPNGNEIAVTETALSRGTYVCEVKKNKTTNVYTAAIKLIDSIVQSDETVTVVKLFKIEDGKVEQYHVGAIILGDKDKGGSSSNPAAFDLEVSESSTGAKTGKIVRCKFVFDGENKSLPDFSVSGSGSVYLVAKQPAPSGSMSDPPWTFEISESKGEAPEGGRVVNYKLYDLSVFAVTCDYRTTFLELKSPHETACLVVKQNSDSTPEIKLSALNSAAAEIYLTPSNKTGGVQLQCDGSTAFLTAKMGTIKFAQIFETGSCAGATFMHETKRIDLRTSNLTKGNLMDIHVLTIKDAKGVITDEFNVLSTKDITITKSGAGKRLVDVTFEVTSGKIVATKHFVDEDGNETSEDVDVCTLTTVGVVTGSKYECPNFVNSKSEVMVVGAPNPLADETVFTSTAHSAET